MSLPSEISCQAAKIRRSVGKNTSVLPVSGKKNKIELTLLRARRNWEMKKGDPVVSEREKTEEYQ
jgi:hypothetical protein